jgi:hypothetical protein
MTPTYIPHFWSNTDVTRLIWLSAWTTLPSGQHDNAECQYQHDDLRDR